MSVIAKVFDIEINEDDLALEIKRQLATSVCSDEDKTSILNRMIDNLVLYYHAIQEGVTCDDDEFDMEFLELLGTIDNTEDEPNLTSDEAEKLERSLRQKIVIRKYIETLCQNAISISDNELLAFYNDQKEVFFKPEAIRASHILIKAETPDARELAVSIRAKMKNLEDFKSICPEASGCPSNIRCGDLGFFPKGRMIPEIENVAFSLGVGDISDVFSSAYGYHILVVTDKVPPAPVPFEEIKDSLRIRLTQLEREFFLLRHIQDLRKKSAESISVLDTGILGS